MAVTADKVVVELELKDGQYLSRVRANERAFTQAQGKVAKSAEDAERRVRAASGGIANALRAAAATIAAGASIVVVKNLADTYTQLQNRLKVTGLEGAGLAQQYERLNKVATDSRTDIESTVQVYSRLRTATEGLGLTNDQVTRTTEILAKSLSSSGATASETSAALLQFSQAIGSGVLQGDELRSIRENAPAVARAIAKEFGVTIGELKKLGEEGKLTSDRVVQAVLASGTEIDALFAKTEATVGNALTNLGNQLLNYVGQTDDSLSATERLSGAINLLADNLDTVVPALTTIVTLIGARYVGAMAGAAAASIGASVTLGALARENVKNTGAALAHAEAELVNARAMAAAALSAGTFATSLTGVGAAQARAAAAATANTVALQANTAGAIAATGATRALSGATALLGGPIGVALLAVTALSAAIIFLGDKMKVAGEVSQDFALANTALEKATNAYTEAANAATIATGKEAVSAKEAAVEKRALAIAARDAAQAKLAEARATIALIQAEAGRQLDLERRAPLRGDRPGSVRTISREDRQRLADAEASAAATRKIIEEANASIASADAAIKAREAFSSTTEDDEKKGPRGPSAETLARRAEQIRRRQEDVIAEEALAIAEARNDTDAITRLERENDIRTRQRDIIDASTEGLIEARTVQQALTEATEAQGRIDEARLEGQQKLVDARNLERNIVLATVDEDSDWLKTLQRRSELQELINTYLDIGFDRVTATSAAESELLEIEQARADANARRLADAEREDALTIARINAVTEGDQARIKALEDQEEILRRIALYTSADGGGLSRADAETRARREVGAIRSATNQAELRSDADLIAKTFVDSIRAGTVWEDLGQRFADAAANNLQQVISQLLQALASSNAGGNSFFGDALKFAATSFGGGRALGGPVRAGFSYDVGENGREKFVAPSNGYIVPNMATANARSAGGGAMSVNINLAGANGDATIQRIAMDAARVGTAQAISQSRQDTANDKRLSRYRMGR